jgi:hypothetical protein
MPDLGLPHRFSGWQGINLMQMAEMQDIFVVPKPQCDGDHIFLKLIRYDSGQ